MNGVLHGLACALAAMIADQSARATIVFNNTTTMLNTINVLLPAGQSDSPEHGNQITLADYYGASFVSTATVVGSDLSAYPNIKRWLGNMKGLKSWAKTFEVIEGFAGSLKGPFEKV